MLVRKFSCRHYARKTMLRLSQSLSFTEDTGLWPLRRGRNLQLPKGTTEEEMCAYTTWMKV